MRALTVLAWLLTVEQLSPTTARPRARELGIAPGTYPTGPNNAITDIAGVRVGHITLIEGDTVRTGVTAILPHAGNIFQEKVPGAVFVGNAFGKLAGSTQVDELGTIETPIILTNTLAVGTAIDALVRWTLAQPGNANVRSVNALVGETNDGTLNDIRGMHVTREHVMEAIAHARGGLVDEGAVGAGTGTIAFGWKGGIGTSSRRVAVQNDTWTVGVLVQTNYGGRLVIDGIPVWKELTPDRENFRLEVDEVHSERAARVSHANGAGITGSPHVSVLGSSRGEGPRFGHDEVPSERAARVSHANGAGITGSPQVSVLGSSRGEAPRLGNDGSCMIVVATDAPLDARDLKRLAARAIYALARTGSSYSNGSGDFAIAFSTHSSLRVTSAAGPQPRTILPTDGVSPLFEAVLEATEEAVDNSLLKATDMTGNGRTIRALPLERLRALLDRPPR